MVTKSPSRFIGRPAAVCRRCNCSAHYVNRLGGIVCRQCDPPRLATDCVQALGIASGVWVDPNDGFGCDGDSGASLAVNRGSTVDAASTPSAASPVATATTAADSRSERLAEAREAYLDWLLTLPEWPDMFAPVAVDLQAVSRRPMGADFDGDGTVGHEHDEDE